MKYLLAICCFFAIVFAKATSKFDFYLETGVSRSIPFSFGFKNNFKAYNTPILGVKTRLSLNRFIVFESGLQFSQNSYQYSSTYKVARFDTNYRLSRYQVDVKLSKLSIPLMLHFGFKKLGCKPEISIGLKYNRVLSGSYFSTEYSFNSDDPKVSYNDTVSFNMTGKDMYLPLPKNSFQNSIGIGVQIAKKLRVSFTINRSFNPWLAMLKDKPNPLGCVIQAFHVYRDDYMFSVAYQIN